MAINIKLSAFKNIGIDSCLDSNLSDLEYLDDSVPLLEDSSKLQIILDHLNECRYVCYASYTFEV